MDGAFSWELISFLALEGSMSALCAYSGTSSSQSNRLETHRQTTHHVGSYLLLMVYLLDESDVHCAVTVDRSRVDL